MRKILFSLLVLLSFSSAFACINYPVLEINGTEYIFSGEFYNNTWTTNELDGIDRLSEQDKTIIADYIVNGYSVFNSNYTEYSEFLDEAEQVNGNETNCLEYKAVYYNSSWTGYVTGTKQGCPATFSDCANIQANIVWNNLEAEQEEQFATLFLGIALATVLVVAVIVSRLTKHVRI